jgi:hypothetical protein
LIELILEQRAEGLQKGLLGTLRLQEASLERGQNARQTQLA